MSVSVRVTSHHGFDPYVRIKCRDITHGVSRYSCTSSIVAKTFWRNQSGSYITVPRRKTCDHIHVSIRSYCYCVSILGRRMWSRLVIELVAVCMNLLGVVSDDEGLRFRLSETVSADNVLHGKDVIADLQSHVIRENCGCGRAL